MFSIFKKKEVVIVPPSFGRRVQTSFSDKAPDFMSDLVYRGVLGFWEVAIKEGATRILHAKTSQSGVPPIPPTPPQP